MQRLLGSVLLLYERIARCIARAPLYFWEEVLSLIWLVCGGIPLALYSYLYIKVVLQFRHGKALRAHISRPIARRSGQRRGVDTQHHQGSSFAAHAAASLGGMFLPYRSQYSWQVERGGEKAGPDHAVRHHEWSVGDIPSGDPGAAGVRRREGLGRSRPAGSVGRTIAIVDDLAAKRRDSALNQFRRR
jgi:hypothetical protein